MTDILPSYPSCQHLSSRVEVPDRRARSNTALHGLKRLYRRRTLRFRLHSSLRTSGFNDLGMFDSKTCATSLEDERLAHKGRVVERIRGRNERCRTGRVSSARELWQTE